MVNILVADDDAWVLRMISMVLARRGYTVEVASDGDEALERALARPPHLLITDAMMPNLDGWSLVKALRARPAYAYLPVIFLSALSSDEDRIRGFRLGADDYITKPLRFEEFDLRVTKTLRCAQTLLDSTRRQIDEVGLRGDLAQVGLAPLLVLLEMERKTGRLSLRAPSRLSAEILVRDGRVIQASLGERTHLGDVECVHHLLSWSAGHFEFSIGPIAGSDRVRTSTSHLLMEGARRLDEEDCAR